MAGQIRTRGQAVEGATGWGGERRVGRVGPDWGLGGGADLSRWEALCLVLGAALPEIHFILLPPPPTPPSPAPHRRAVECTSLLGGWLMPKWGSGVLIPWAGVGEMLILWAGWGWSPECAPTPDYRHRCSGQKLLCVLGRRGGGGEVGEYTEGTAWK